MADASKSSAAQIPSLPQELFEPFSYPGVPGTLQALEAIWPTFAEEATRYFLESHRQHFDRRAASLASWLRDRIEQLSFAEAWHPTVGLMAQPASATKRPVALAAMFALHLSATADAGAWTAEPEPESPIRLRNLLARPERLEVRATGDGAEVTVADGGSTASVRVAAAGGEVEALGPLRRVGVVLSSPAPILVTDGSIPGDVFFVEEADPFTASELERFARDVQAGLEFIAEYAPEYVGWVATATTVLVPCRAPAEMMLSGSSNTLPGLIRVTADRPAPTTAEMLVHEASHQYLHAALRVDAVDDGSDPETYYSPVRSEHRPLDKILTAYHAFANVEIFYATALDNGWRPSDSEREAAAAVGGEVDVLEGPLRENPALTTLGRALVDPIASARRR